MRKIIVMALTIFMLTPLCTFGTSAEESANAAPTVIPAVREWQGGQGKYELKDGAKLVLKTKTPGLEKKAEIIKNYFKDMLSFEIGTAEGTPSQGDILLVLDKSQKNLGSESYLLEVGDSITVTATDEQGILYGCITILQSLYADGFVPKGTAKDYPYYPIRSGMVDVARAYIPLEYVEEITKYMAWFKLNEIHLHINDSGENNYRAFRLESDVPGLTAKDGFYSKKDYRDYQKRMLDYGISVITEIDTPAHSKCFNGVLPNGGMLDENHINIGNPDSVKFVKDLFDEYITGDDPVFVNKKVHIGTDEYPIEYSEQMRAYTDTLIKHINSRGYTPRFWGSFGNEGFNGSTPVSNKAEANFWAVSLSDYKTLFSMDYDIINTCGPMLYIVPGGNYGFADYYNLQSLYKNWFVNYLGYNESTSVSPDDKQLKGASFALWNDRHTAYGGFSTFDIFDRLRGAVCLISEKTWCGEQTRQIDAQNFTDRFEILSKKAGNTNPGRTQSLPIKGTESKDVKSVGFPYVASFSVKADSFSDNCVLFGGSDGKVVLNKDGTVSLLREGYEFLYKCKIEAGKDTKLKLIADNKKTILVVDDTYFYHPVNKRNPSLNESSTFVFPLESLGENLKGSISNLLIEENKINLNDMRLDINRALGKKVTVSGLEVSDGTLNEPLAVDGNLGTRLSFARDTDEQWLVVDLGAEYPINKVVINFFESIKEYKILVSTDGENYNEVFYEKNSVEREKRADTVTFATVNARYIKYQQLKRFHIVDWNAYYSGGISEFEVYGYDKDVYDKLITEADTLLDNTIIDKDKKTDLRNARKALVNYMESGTLYTTHINALKDKLSWAIEVCKNPFAQSEVSNESAAPVQKGSFPWWAIAAGAAVIIAGAAAFVIFKTKKKKI